MLPTLDLAIIGIYLISVLGLGFILGRKESTSGFFVNEGKTRTALLIFTALSTSIGAGSVIGIAGEATKTGLSFGLTFAIVSLLAWLFIAWIAPRIKEWGNKINAYTFGDFLAARYSNRTRRLGSLIVLVAYFVITSVQFVAFANLAKIIGGVSFESALVITTAITIAYTIMAGIKGDIYTDAIQFFVMFPVFIALFIIGFSQIDPDTLFNELPKEFFHPFTYDGPIFFFGASIFGFALLLVSMEVWQRIFAARDGKTARRAFIFSAFLKVTVIFASIILGFLAYHFLPSIENSDLALFELMETLLPSGLLGLGFASILAILMSTIDSMLMVGSATLTKDFYMVYRPHASEEQKLLVGRVSVFLFGVASFLVALIYQDIITLSLISVQILSVFTAALFGGLLWKHATEKAAFYSILLSFLGTIILLPFFPTIAALPPLILSIIVFTAISLAQKNVHGKLG